MGGEKILSLLNRLKSHPDKLLYDHLQKVGDLCQKNLSLKKLNIDEYVDFNILRDISYLIGITHDFGKSTSYFQDYLQEQDEIKKIELKNKPETHHGFISALFTYYITKQYLSEISFVNEKYYQYLPVISFLVVKKHHGNLINVLDEVIDFDQKNEEIFSKQINSINFNEINFIYQNLFSKINFKYDCNLFKKNILESSAVYIYNKLDRYEKKYVRDLSHQEKKLIRNLDEEDTLFYYFITLLLYSLLLDADKIDAADLKEVERINTNENVVDKYLEQKFKRTKKEEHKINTIRNAIYHEVTANLDDLNLDKDRLLSLNVPTGTGKTLTSLSFALKLREKIEREKGYKARIIYSLPYLSIIDQNFAVFEDVFKLSLKGKHPSSDLLLKHHHLSDVIYTTINFGKEEFENISPKDISKDILLIEGWNSEIIVTTFIQLFYSLISNRNKAIRKFHNIINSIIILDEVQAIPHYYWLLLNKMANFLAEKFNIYFILITATQPLLFNEKAKEIKSVLKNKEAYFNALNRVELILNLESICLNDFKEILGKDLIDNSHKDFLIVLNTINSSQEIFNFIKELNLENTKYYYLSAGVIPKVRLERIKGSKKESRKRKIIVSTQLIEAGVDLDVDIVYRDFAPLDSINQVAGRCNRNFSQKKGMVKIFVLKQEEEKREFHKFIYDPFIISKTKDTFKELKNNKITEKDFLNLSNFYFDKVSQGKADDKSTEILGEVKKLNFEEVSKFRLIEEDFRKVDIFIEIDKEAHRIYKKYQELGLIKNNFERKNEFLQIRKDFYKYVISVPYQYAADFIKDKDIGYISKEEIEQSHYYDEETGFKREKQSGGGTLIY
ncbi:MAG: CRISPR-associated helicase/endonuclease Cas3 [Candidatus Altiarchaeales archaeon HGW-Altiarchaeales-3]|nr:MAG: CRISPR-associated helicase/endonuclease Cas3 [Candidatus Altiarchaeales archaeon HGW-Altiarchaeales-3]